MDTFDSFPKLPLEIQLMIWEAAIPTSPTINFLRFPNKKGGRNEYSNLANPTRPWKAETSTLRRHPHGAASCTNQQSHCGRYSSYLSGAALLQCCSNSRKVYIDHRNRVHNDYVSDREKYDPCWWSSTEQGDSLVKVGTHHVLDLSRDLLVIQDPDPKFPWNTPRRLVMNPPLRPAKLAIEYYEHVWQSNGAASPKLPSNRLTQGNSRWLPRLLQYTELERYGAERPLTSESVNPERMRGIFIIDYRIRPKASPANAPDDSRALNNKPPKVKHNGMFRGHGATFYAIDREDNEVMAFWDIPKGVRQFQARVQDTSNWSMMMVWMEMRWTRFTDTPPPGIPVYFMACVED